jgi:cytochrome P450
MAEKNTLFDKATQWVLNNLGMLFSILRWVKPNLVFKGQALITCFDDVQEVLSRNDVFHVPYAQKMGSITDGGNFFLGMQETPTYTRDVSNMRLAIRREDIPERITPYVKKACTEILAASGGQIDVVHDLTRVVATGLMGDYLGTPGWDQNEFTDAATVMFDYLFYPDNPEIEKKALAAAQQTRDYLDQTISKRKKNRGIRDDVLERCLSMQDAGLPGMSDLEIRNNLIGIIIGAIPTTSKCAADILNYLLDKSDLLVDAQQCAVQDDDQMMLQYVLETLRLNPFALGIQRVCAEDYVVARGTLRSTQIPKGTKVIAATQSAMMDCRKIKKPKQFRLDRPAYQYMHFGYSLHSCFGYYINIAQIPEIVKAVLMQKGLSRAPGTAGIIKSDGSGPFPVHMGVQFEV